MIEAIVLNYQIPKHEESRDDANMSEIEQSVLFVS